MAGRPLAVTCLVDTAEGPPERLAPARGTHPVLWCDGADLPNPDLRQPPGPPGTGGVPVRVTRDGTGVTCAVHARIAGARHCRRARCPPTAGC